MCDRIFLNSNWRPQCPTKKKPNPKKEEKPAPKDNLVATKHSIKIGGKTTKYTITTGTVILKEEVNDKEKDAEIEKPHA